MQPNWTNQTIWTGDNLDIMRGMNSESVDLIYLDPPFNSNANYAAPIGSEAAGAEFKNTWGLSDVNIAWHGLIKHDYPGLYALLGAVRQVHGDSMTSYLTCMAVRIMEMKRLLKPSASVWLHCDPTASHYLKLPMDAVFGKANFRNEIVWCYTGPGAARKRFPRKHDILFFYAMGKGNIFNRDSVRVPYKKLNTQDGGGIGGELDSARIAEYMKRGKAPESWWTGFLPVGRIHKERVGYPTQKPVALLQRIALSRFRRTRTTRRSILSAVAPQPVSPPKASTANGRASTFPRKRPIWFVPECRTSWASCSGARTAPTSRSAPT